MKIPRTEKVSNVDPFISLGRFVAEFLISITVAFVVGFAYVFVTNSNARHMAELWVALGLFLPAMTFLIAYAISQVSKRKRAIGR